MSSKAELSVVYVNWNALAYLRDSISSVYQYTRDTLFEIIVVDNASSEAGLESLREQFPAIKILRSSQNVGFAVANNLGFRHSVGDYVLFLNPDTQLIDPSIDTLLAHYKMLPDAGVMGCKLLNSDLSLQLSSIDAFPTILNQALDSEYFRHRWPSCPLWKLAPLFVDNSLPVRVEVISGACILLRRHIFDQVGQFSEEYFMYAEDLDLSCKVHDAGFQNYYLGSTAIIHHGGKSSAGQLGGQWSTIMKFRAMVELFRNSRGNAYAIGYRCVMGITAVCRLSLLMVMLALSSEGTSRALLRQSWSKWLTILKSSISSHSVPLTSL